jgi:putative acetyltransferase
VRIRDALSGEAAAISNLVSEAFASAPHSSGTEAEIVAALRDAGALAVSLVALRDEAIVGHVALSAVTIPGAAGWFALGPVSVRPACQRQGLGAALVRAALERLRKQGAAGCVVIGNPTYYGRFGFAHRPCLSYRDLPAPYLQALAFAGAVPAGEVAYHPAFDAA